MRQGGRDGFKKHEKKNVLKEGETLKTKKHYCESLMALGRGIFWGRVFFMSSFFFFIFFSSSQDAN